MVKWPGTGGRKPKSETGESSPTFSMRLRPEMRELLEKMAAAQVKPVSYVIDKMLREGFERKFRRGGMQQLALALELLGQSVENVTGKKVLDDVYTFDAVRAAINIFLDEIKPEGESVVPDRVETVHSETYFVDPEVASKLSPEQLAAIQEVEELQYQNRRQSKYTGEAMAERFVDGIDKLKSSDLVNLAMIYDIIRKREQ